MKSAEFDRLYEYFKHDDASSDFSLEKTFIKPPRYRSLKDRKTHVLVGQYGSGKTALLQDLFGKFEYSSVTTIQLNTEPFAEELKIASASQDFSTFARALVTLRFIYDYAVDTTGKIRGRAGEALVNELKSVGLHPYGDLIERLYDSISGFVGSIKKIDFWQTIGLEREIDTAPKKLTTKRFRDMVLRIEPLVRKRLDEKSLIVVDSVDPERVLIEETANLMRALILWLKQLGVGFIVTLPYPVYYTFVSGGANVPFHDLFFRLDWTNERLKQMISRRINVALDRKVEAETWVKENLGLDLTEAVELTFGRPRDCIKLVRKCLDAMDDYGMDNPQLAWEFGRQDYKREVLDWMASDWAVVGGGWDEFKAMLSNIGDNVTRSKLIEAIDELRQETGVLRKKPSARILANLRELKLVERFSRGKQVFYRVHPIFSI